VFKTFDSNTPVSVPLARCSLGLSCYCQRTTQQLLRYTHRQRASLLPPLDVIANVQFHAQEGAGTFIPTMHSAFDDPQCEDNATPRESVECRICAPSHLHLASTCLPQLLFSPSNVAAHSHDAVHGVSRSVCFLPPKGGFGLVGKAKIGLAVAKMRLRAKL